MKVRSSSGARRTGSSRRRSTNTEAPDRAHSAHLDDDREPRAGRHRGQGRAAGGRGGEILPGASDPNRFFGQQGRRLRGVSFEVKAGENFGIVGESGCGKSTLSRACSAWSKSRTAGKIFFEGADISGMNRQRDARPPPPLPAPILRGPLQCTAAAHMPVGRTIAEALYRARRPQPEGAPRADARGHGRGRACLPRSTTMCPWA